MFSIDYLADCPQYIEPLLKPLITAWQHVIDDDNLDKRRIKLTEHLNKQQLPIAWVAHESGKVLGIAALRQFDLPGCQFLSPWLAGVFVLPEYRNQGIASALCQHVEQAAWQQGHDGLYLFTLDKQHLYRKLGWRHHSKALWLTKDVDVMCKQKTSIDKSISQ